MGEAGDDGGGTSSSGGGEKFDVGNADSGAEDGGPTLPPCEEAAMAKSNQGCEFWAVDLPNVWDDPASSFPAAEDMQFAIVVANTSSEDEVTVGVFKGGSVNAYDFAVVAPGATHEFCSLR